MSVLNPLLGAGEYRSGSDNFVGFTDGRAERESYSASSATPGGTFPISINPGPFPFPTRGVAARGVLHPRGGGVEEGELAYSFQRSPLSLGPGPAPLSPIGKYYLPSICQALKNGFPLRER